MRFAERRLSLLAPLALSLALAGCASLQEPLKTLQEAVTPSSSAKAPASAPASAPAPAASAPTPAPVVAAPVDTAPPVSPQVQRDFDNARRLLAAGRSADAERAFAAIAQAHPELGGAHANLGLIYRQAGKPTEAVAALEKAVQASPKQPLYFNQLGIAYRQAGQFNKARGAYERAIELDENYAAAVLNLGILHDIYLRDAKRALELYERYQLLTAGKDATVTRWVAELKNRKPEPGNVLVKKEQP